MKDKLSIPNFTGFAMLGGSETMKDKLSIPNFTGFAMLGAFSAGFILGAMLL
jgi:hypothetical protein